MRIVSTHVILEMNGSISDMNMKFHKAYEMEDGSHTIESDGHISFIDAEVFYEWSENYKFFVNHMKKIKK